MNHPGWSRGRKTGFSRPSGEPKEELSRWPAGGADGQRWDELLSVPLSSSSFVFLISPFSTLSHFPRRGLFLPARAPGTGRLAPAPADAGRPHSRRALFIWGEGLRCTWEFIIIIFFNLLTFRQGLASGEGGFVIVLIGIM